MTLPRRRYLFSALPMVLLGVVGLWAVSGGCNHNNPEEIKNVKVGPGTKAPKVNPAKVKFTDVTAKGGLQFKHVNGSFGRKLLPETLGSGCAFFDFDGDGHQDLLLVSSCHWPGFQPKDEPAPTLALYRNKGDGTFEDVTKDVGLDVTFFGMGVAVGDYDNDGLPDLFVTAVGGSHLFHNTKKDGKHRFIDVTKTAGDLTKDWNMPDVEGAKFLAWEPPITFPSSVAFLDYDKDGLLDLFVCNYVQWSPKIDLVQGFNLNGKLPAFGPPTAFEGTFCQLFRNKGNSIFEDVSRKAGVHVLDTLGKPAGKSLGVLVADVNEDGWPDVFVANDTVRNFFFLNKGDGTFQECGEQCGAAYAQGKARGAMGIDWGEYRPGKCAFVIGNFANEPDTLLRLDKMNPLVFSDVAEAEGVAGPSRLPLVFGMFFFDYDLDGRLDFLSNNGHLEPKIHIVRPGEAFRQPPQLFWNTGAKVGFELVTEEFAGADLFKPLVGRGSAYADVDGNGTPDIVLMDNGGPARLLKNEGGTGHHWVRLDLRGDGKRCNTSAIGARIVLKAGDKAWKREVIASRSYLSCCELPVTFGLGKADRVDRVEIHWPGRDVPPTVLTDLAVDRTHVVALK